MNKFLYTIVMATLLVGVLFTGVAAGASTTSISLLNPPPGGVLELAVGESYTFEVEVAGDLLFTMAVATLDQEYPGRGIFASGADSARQNTSATLQLTVTGKEPTLGATNVPGDSVPVGIVVAVRYPGGQVVSQRFDFNIIVR